ncbi:MAG TPA: GWxTD domain-containing protein, partial [Gemmatimonadales bacterium]|nr:GWxTD domain-containing protein [Gemmatimonadales bacterium]
LESFRDSVATVSDTAGLRRFERSLGRPPATSPIDALRDAIVALRLGTRGDLTRALDSCRAVARAEPDWGYPWFCIGLAAGARGRSTAAEPLNLGLIPGRGDFERSADAFLAAARAEPGFVPAAAALGELVLGREGAERRTEALPIIRAAAPTALRTPPSLLLLRGRLERLAGDPDSALAAFRAYDAGGGDHALALLEEARTELTRPVPPSDAESLYYTGAALDDSVAVAGYRHDLRYLVADSALRGFDAARGEDRASWLRRFWEARDLVDLQPAGARLAAHYRRLVYAEQHYTRRNGRRIGWCDPGRGYESGLPDLDDRGVVYVRYGPPTLRVTTPVWGMMPAESWRYDLPDADTVVVHFLDLHNVNDYRLAPTALSLAAVPGCGDPDAAPLAVMQSRAVLLPDYDRWLSGSDLERARLGRRDIQRGEVTIPRITSTDIDPLRFARELRGVGRVSVLGAADSGALAHFAFGVFVPESLAERVGRQPAVRLVAMQRGGRVDAWRGTPGDSRLVAGDSGWWLVGHIALPAHTGVTYLRLAVLAGDSVGAVVGWDSVAVPNAHPGPGLSPLTVGTRSRGIPWAADAGDTAFFSPFRSVRRGDPLEIYAELTGARAGASYEVALVLVPTGRGLTRRLLGRAPPRISVQWRAVADGTTVPIRRTVGVGALVPGAYVIRLEVRMDGRNFRAEDRVTIE